jgi:hypothetical protein
MVRDIANTTCVDVAIEEHQYVAIDRCAAAGAALDVTLGLEFFLKHRPMSRGKQSRRAEYNRPTASPRWVRMGTISGADTSTALVLRRNETRALS